MGIAPPTEPHEVDTAIILTSQMKNRGSGINTLWSRHCPWATPWVMETKWSRGTSSVLFFLFPWTVSVPMLRGSLAQWAENGCWRAQIRLHHLPATPTSRSFSSLHLTLLVCKMGQQK